MGCDIKAHIEFIILDTKDEPVSQYLAQVYIARDYRLFSILAGVRSQKDDPPVSLPKGFPVDIHSPAAKRCAYEIDDELAELEVDGFCSRVEAEKWVNEGIAEFVDDRRSRVSDPDAHSASWLSLEEIETANQHYFEIAQKAHIELSAILGTMRALKEIGVKSRLVFWFKG